MYTTTQLDNGILNNYAVEPEMTYAEYPDFYEQKNYLKQSLYAALFVAVLVATSFVVS